MNWIKTLRYSCGLLLFLACSEVRSEAQCELSPYQSVTTITQLQKNLETTVNYCKKKIGEVETRKKALEIQMKKTEAINVKFAHEKREKAKKIRTLSESIAKLRKEIGRLQGRISSTTAQISKISRHIAEVGRRIVAASRRVNNLRNTINSKQGHINALERRIQREKSKRRCGFRRKRRSVGHVRVRRGWGFLGKVVREVGRVVHHILVKHNPVLCVVNNIISRLSRAKEKAEREKNRLNRQLLQAQREKVNIEGQKRKLIAQKNADNRVLSTLNRASASMRSKLGVSSRTKVRTEYDICVLTSRIKELTNLLQTTDKQLKYHRQAKTKLLSILTQLKTIHNEKLEDLREMEEAGDDASDLLDEIKEINEGMKTSIETLITITCSRTYRSYRRSSINGGIARLMQVKPTGCSIRSLHAIGPIRRSGAMHLPRPKPRTVPRSRPRPVPRFIPRKVTENVFHKV